MSQFAKFKTSAEAATYAESCGFEVIHGNDLTLLLDIDSGEAFVQFEKYRDLVDKLVGIEDCSVWNSQSAKHHVMLKLKKPLPIEVRLMFQACLGSDPERELLTYGRIQQGEKEPMMLFRPKKWNNKWKNAPKMQDPLSTGTRQSDNIPPQPLGWSIPNTLQASVQSTSPRRF